MESHLRVAFLLKKMILFLIKTVYIVCIPGIFRLIRLSRQTHTRLISFTLYEGKYIMASTTFSGPVTSLAGFITGPNVASTVTAATLAVTAADYNGQVINLSRAAGIVVTLPAATGSNAVYKFVVATTVTSNNYIIKVANSTDTFNGLSSVGGGTASVFGTLPASDTITMNGSTTGGLAGSYVEITDIAAGDYIVNAALVGSGSPATPFSATV
jgi:hypothetical protein